MICFERQADLQTASRWNRAGRWMGAGIIALGLVATSGCAAYRSATGDASSERIDVAAAPVYEFAERDDASLFHQPLNSAPVVIVEQPPQDALNIKPSSALGAGDQPVFGAPSSDLSNDAVAALDTAEEEPNGEPGGPDDGPGGPPAGLGGPGDEPGYKIAWYPSASVAGQDTDMSILRNSLLAEVPVYFEGADAVMLSAGVDNSHFSGNAVLPDSMRPFPDDLWNIELGLKYMHQFSNGWTGMMMADVGSPSDRPFHALRDMSYQLGGFLQIPAQNGRDSWMVGAMYSPSGTPNFPIPMLAYNWNPSETFHMNIGVPFSLNWQPTEELSFDISYTPLLDNDALANYKLSDQLRAYGGYQYVTDAYFLSDRVHDKDQFFAIEQRLIVGVRRDLGEHMAIDVNAGYAFDRHFGEGDDQLNLRDRVNLESGAFMAGQLTWKF
jgi:hypothetical protein